MNNPNQACDRTYMTAPGTKLTESELLDIYWEVDASWTDLSYHPSRGTFEEQFGGPDADEIYVRLAGERNPDEEVFVELIVRSSHRKIVLNDDGAPEVRGKPLPRIEILGAFDELPQSFITMIKEEATEAAQLEFWTAFYNASDVYLACKAWTKPQAATA